MNIYEKKYEATTRLAGLLYENGCWYSPVKDESGDSYAEINHCQGDAGYSLAYGGRVVHQGNTGEEGSFLDTPHKAAIRMIEIILQEGGDLAEFGLCKKG